MIKVKVCGMKHLQNIQEIVSLKPDFMGFIFYAKSARYVGENFIAPTLNNINKTGVFVNETIEKVIELYTKNKLNYVQLHGDESPEYCKILKEKGIKIIKVFLIETEINYAVLNTYKNYCSYFLFDTFSKQKGGSGLKFNWQILTNYNLEIPFFLSGGISVTDVELINNLNIKQLVGIDINSKFEIEPGLKNSETIKNFLYNLKQNSQ